MKFLINIALRFLPCVFDATNMNRIQVGTCTLWVYKSNDLLLAGIDASGYFDSHAPLLRQGDLILVASDVDGTPLADLLIVTSADNATPVTTTTGT